MICKDLVKSFYLETQNVIEVMQVVKMLCNQICQSVPAVVTENSRNSVNLAGERTKSKTYIENLLLFGYDTDSGH